MKKFYFFAACAAAVLVVGCAKNEVYQTPPQEQPVSFSVYTHSTPDTKTVGGELGSQTNNTLGDASKSGFGVFCFYSNNSTNGTSNDYTASPTSNFVPNFMWNQQVKGNGNGSSAATAWTYSPVKYWPNEYNASVTAQGIDKLTFFAYAPWVDAVKTTGVVTGADEGITRISSNDTAVPADPTLTYVVPASIANHVDVLYADATSLKNLTKPASNAAVAFPFKHALTSVVFRVQTFIDGTNNTGNLEDLGGDITSGTTVTLKEVHFGGATVYPSGTLNIATGAWNPVSATSKTFDKTGLTHNVTKAKADVAGMTPIMLIPNASAATYNIRVVYDVITADDKLAAESITVTNDIKNTMNLTLQAGKKNIIDLVLGLYSVKMTATVTDWEAATAVEVDLPANN